MLMGLSWFTMDDSCINYPNMLPLYTDNSWYQGKKKYKCDMQKPDFLGEETSKGCIL